jgi:uncharacterized protein (DUF2249 family)
LTQINAVTAASTHSLDVMNAPASEIPFDVRAVPPRDRHPRIFALWESLPQGGCLRLISDHEPLPLYYQFAAEYAGTFRWEVLEARPERWQVRLTRGDFPETGFTPTRPSPRPKPAPAPITFADLRRFHAAVSAPIAPAPSTPPVTD